MHIEWHYFWIIEDLADEFNRYIFTADYLEAIQIRFLNLSI